MLSVRQLISELQSALDDEDDLKESSLVITGGEKDRTLHSILTDYDDEDNAVVRLIFND